MNASTLQVVNAVKEALPEIQKTAPKGVELKLDFDQSIFVRAAVSGVLREALIAAGLVSLMVLFFLGINYAWLLFMEPAYDAAGRQDAVGS